MKLSQLAEILNTEMVGDPDIEISGVASIDEAGEGQLASLHSRRFVKFLETTRASAVIVEPSLRDSEFAKGRNLLIASNVTAALEKAVLLFAPEPIHYEKGIHHTAFVAPSAVIDETASVGPLCVIMDGARIGRNTVLVAGVYVGHETSIGDDCFLYAGVVVCERCRIGSRVVMQAGAVIGSEGFGFEPTGALPRKIPQIGDVVIEDDVEIGACTCVDRARFATTLIMSGTKIDNLCQVAHNVRVGRNCLIAAHTGLAGTVKLGNHVMMGGQSGSADHVTIGDGAILYARTGATKDIPPGAIVSGLPPLPRDEDLRQQVNIRRIPKISQQVRELEERILALEAKIQDLSKKS